MKNKKSKKNNKYSLLHKSNVKFAKKNLELLSENANLKDSLIKVENNLDDILQVKESLQLQNQTLEKRLLATEVELLRKIVKLYEDNHTTSYPQYNGNGITTSTSSTMLGV
tara:strand:- start:149 stop:481 length:333 start_codon:yes stop_codon:yes gene_type:complete